MVKILSFNIANTTKKFMMIIIWSGNFIHQVSWNIP